MNYLHMIPGPEFTAKDLREIVGLSYRQLNDWDSKGLVAATRGVPGGWRKFTYRQIFSLGICGELSDRFGVQPSQLVMLHTWLEDSGFDHFRQTLKMMNMHGGGVFLVTDLDRFFILETDVRIAWIMRDGFFAKDSRPAGLLLLRLNDLVNRVLQAAGSPHRFKGNRRGYELDRWRQVAQAPPRLKVREQEVVDLIREGRFTRVEIELVGKSVKMLYAEEELGVGDADKIVGIIEDENFQTVKLTRRNGAVTRLTRRLPIRPGKRSEG